MKRFFQKVTAKASVKIILGILQTVLKDLVESGRLEEVLSKLARDGAGELAENLRAFAEATPNQIDDILVEAILGEPEDG